MITMENFLNDSHGATYRDVVEDSRLDYQLVIDFFNNEAVRVRLCDSELHHDRPPLAGVIKEFESIPAISEFFERNDSHSTTRFRQSIGDLVRQHMAQMGWTPTDKKGSLGKRMKVDPNTTTPGAYKNKYGLSTWFTEAKRYTQVSS